MARSRTLPGAIVKSDLPFRQPQHQAVEFRRDLDLARQAAVGLTSGGGTVEQRVLLIAHRGQPVDPFVIDIDMAGGAHGIAAAFGHDLVDAMPRRSLHRALADVGLDLLGPAVGTNESNDRHGTSTQAGVKVTGRVSSPRSVLL